MYNPKHMKKTKWELLHERLEKIFEPIMGCLSIQIDKLDLFLEELGQNIKF